MSAKGLAVTWGTTTTFTYNGAAQGPTASAASGVTGEKINVTRTTGTNAGSYTSTASISSVTGGRAKAGNYKLTGNTKAFTIGKADLSLTLSATSANVNYANGTGAFTVTPSGYKGEDTGTLAVASSDTNYLTITSGNTATTKNNTAITVGYKGIKYTTTQQKVTVSIAATTNYNSISKTFAVTIVDTVAPNVAPTVTAKRTNSSGETLKVLTGTTSNTGPTVVWTNVASTYLSFSGGADEGSGVYTYAYSTTAGGTKTDASTLTVTATTTGVTYYVYTKDKVGNYSTIYTAITIKLDTVIPTIGTVTAQIVSGTQLNVNVTGGADNASGIKSYIVYSSNGTQQGSVNSTSSSSTVTITNNIGWYADDYVVKAQDNAGNLSSPYGISFYTVNDLSGLKGLATAVNSTTSKGFEGRTVKQTADFSVSGFTPIGTNTKNFKGTYDGQSKTLKYDNQVFNSQYSGIFGYASYATIKNTIVSGNVTVKAGNSGGIVGTGIGLTITGCTSLVNLTSTLVSTTTSTDNGIGGIIGTSGLTTGNTITDCKFSGSITGQDNIGGILGATQNVSGDTIKNCISSGIITATGDSIGGIAGHLGGTVTKCTNYATIKSSGSYVGGIAGQTTGTSAETSDCINEGNVYISTYSGGIVGNSNTPIKRCGNNASMLNRYATGGLSYIGGIVGWSTAEIIASYNRGDIETSGGQCVGGIVGNANPGTTVTYSYNVGQISGAYSLGGIVGSGNYSGDALKYCYSAKGPSSGSTYGALVGSFAGTITNCYYLSGLTSSKGTAQAQYYMKVYFPSTETQYVADGCDGNSLKNSGFPRLLWECTPKKGVICYSVSGSITATQITSTNTQFACTSGNYAYIYIPAYLYRENYTIIASTNGQGATGKAYWYRNGTTSVEIFNASSSTTTKSYTLSTSGQNMGTGRIQFYGGVNIQLSGPVTQLVKL